jgi:hypothetical protein
MKKTVYDLWHENTILEFTYLADYSNLLPPFEECTVSHCLSGRFLSTQQRKALPSLVAAVLAKVEVSGEDEGIYPCHQGRSDSRNCGVLGMPSPEISLLVSLPTAQDDL